MNETNEVFDIINGNLLADSSIRSDKDKYFTFQIVAKDKKFLEWFGKLLKEFRLKYWISRNKSNLFLLGVYINSCPYKKFLQLRDKWYKQLNGKAIKVVPRDLELTSTTLLFWYLGDGSLPRRKNDKNRVPPIVLATNSFSKEDINFLIQKLKELNLNFYPVKYKSGFTSEECGYCLYSNIQDGTPFRFFKLIGFECPKEIANCFTGRKGRGSKLHYFKDKWPTKEDWIKILSNEKWVGKVIKERRKQINLTRKELTQLLDVNEDYIRKIEYGKRNPSVSKFRKILNTLNIYPSYLLNKLR